MKKIIILFALFSCLLPFGVYGAGLCEYQCNSSFAWQTDTDFCTAQVQGGTQGKMLSSDRDCDLGDNVNLICTGSKKICCCSPGISNISGAAKNTSITSLNFTPEISIPGSVFNNQTPIQAGQAYDTISNGVTTVTMKSDLLAKYIQALYTYALSIVSILAAIVLMGGGLIWLTSGGDSSKVTKAKEMIIGSISGLAILFCAWIILNTVNPDLLQLKTIDTVVINRINMTCCEKSGKAEIITDKDCKDKGGQSFIGFSPNSTGTKCEQSGCCITKSTQNNKIVDCYNSMERNCTVTNDEKSNGSIYLTIATTFLKSSCETAKNTEENLKGISNCPDNCANAKDGTSCGGVGSGYCYYGICWKWKGKEGEPCGNDGGICTKDTIFKLGICGNGGSFDARGRDCVSGPLSGLNCCIPKK